MCIGLNVQVVRLTGTVKLRRLILLHVIQLGTPAELHIHVIQLGTPTELHIHVRQLGTPAELHMHGSPGANSIL